MTGRQPEPSSVSPGAGQFPQTLWSVVLTARDKPSEYSERALSSLCSSYWYPLYAYLRRGGYNSPDAQDLTQGFFLHLLEKYRLGNVSPDKGKFRSFLLASLQNFLSDERDKAQAKKRGGGARLLSLDEQDAEARYRYEPVDRLDPEKIYERRWALMLLDRALAKLEGEHGSESAKQRFEQLRVYLLGDPAADRYAEVARRLGMTEGAVKVAVLRLRQRYRELFRAEVAETVGSEGEVEEEMRHILSVLSS